MFTEPTHLADMCPDSSDLCLKYNRTGDVGRVPSEQLANLTEQLIIIARLSTTAYANHRRDRTKF